MNKTVKTLTAAALSLTLAGALSGCHDNKAGLAITSQVGRTQTVPVSQGVTVQLQAAELDELPTGTTSSAWVGYTVKLVFTATTSDVNSPFTTDPYGSVAVVDANGTSYTADKETLLDDNTAAPNPSSATYVDLNRAGQSEIAEVMFTVPGNAKISSVLFGYSEGSADVLSWSL
jgi:hypothetical protein